MAVVQTTPGGNIVGCMDPAANNFDPSATIDSGDCQYGIQNVGCTDPLASNYQATANVSCDNCCTYQSPIEMSVTTGIIRPIGFGTITTGTATDIPTGFVTTENPCPGPYSQSTDTNGSTIILGVENAQCCSQTNTQLPPLSRGVQYYWDGKVCKIITSCPTTTCIDCINFDWWNDTYIANHKGQSLSTSSPILWQQIVDVITNSGQTISINSLDGELTSEECCQGVFRDGICFCEEIIEEEYKPRCISNLSDFLNFISTPSGYNFFVTNFQTIGPSLGLTPQQTNYILLNINNNLDSDINGITDATEARLILSNALDVTGGFHVNFGVITNTPKLMTKGVCDQYGGFWDGPETVTPAIINTGSTIDIQISDGPNHLITQLGLNPVNASTGIPTSTSISTSINGNCMCKPVVDQCDIDITQVKVVVALDFFNNPIQLVELASTKTPLTEACCNRLIKDYDLPWEWQAPFCLAVKRDDCLPVTFSFNNEIMEVPPCENDLEISMWVYFGKPENPCQPIPDPPDTDIITIDGAFCDITLTPNTGAINPTLDGEIKNPIMSSSIGDKFEINTRPKSCCYNINNPIIAGISLTDPILNSFLTQVTNYNSTTDYFDRWVQVKATLPTSGLTLNFGVNLEIYQGLNCCCNYDVFVDDIRVNCSRQEPALIINDIECPGFNLTKVIDNKKSWVYNPGIASVGISEYDNIEREDGSDGTLNGEGTINRTFAPSLDANIPWRYTDYWQQSSVYEKHSNLVLNSKELWLTFDMCADCPISGTTLVCPNGFTLSANTQICYQDVELKLFQNGDDFIFMDGDNYIFQFQ